MGQGVVSRTPTLWKCIVIVILCEVNVIVPRVVRGINLKTVSDTFTTGVGVRKSYNLDGFRLTSGTLQSVLGSQPFILADMAKDQLSLLSLIGHV